MKITWQWLLVLVVLQAQAGEATEKAIGPQQVIINGSPSELEASRGEIASRVSIGRTRIDKSGAQNVAEILRSEPSITVGKDGRIGLLGLPGYTQVLIDGLPPQGVDPYTLDLAHVEKIEIIKSSTATTGPFGVAGTINIIRRKAGRKPVTQARLEGLRTSNRTGADLSWSKGDLISPLSYNVTISASSRETPRFDTFVQNPDRAGISDLAGFEGERKS
ncbi:MAG: TonB-dependent receptor plug domain-containing protein, partial [Telluria sp.]